MGRTGADKFGNVFCLRLPAEVSEDMEDDPTGSAVKWDVSRTGSAAHKVDCAAIYHVGETVHSLTKATLQPGGLEALVYSTLLGGVGAMVPFSSKDDVEFFQQLEMHMRQEVIAPPRLRPAWPIRPRSVGPRYCRYLAPVALTERAHPLCVALFPRRPVAWL